MDDGQVVSLGEVGRKKLAEPGGSMKDHFIDGRGCRGRGSRENRGDVDTKSGGSGVENVDRMELRRRRGRDRGCGDGGNSASTLESAMERRGRGS